MRGASDVAANVGAAFERNFLRGAEVGAAVSVWKDGAELVSLAKGWRDAQRSMPWEQDTLVLIWSATKGLASTCVLHALDQANVSLETPVSAVWPGFARAGKERVTFAQVLSHRAGLGALDAKDLSILDHEAVVCAVEEQTPQWEISGEHGYGPRTYGFIADEIVRRVAGGVPLGNYWRKNFGEPLELDLWIGLPESEHPRVAQMLAARAGCGDTEDEFHEALANPASLTRKAFLAPGGLPGASAMNSPVARSASIPSLGGIGSARALAKFYCMLAIGGQWEGRRFVSENVLRQMSTPLAQGPDKVLMVETAFSAGFMMDPLDAGGVKKRKTFGPAIAAFGHPGAGGSLGFADPENGIGFAYVMNQMETGVLPKARALGLVEAIYS